MAPVREECILRDARTSTPAKLGGTRHEQEEASERFNDASRAFYLIVDTGQPERLARIGELMDECALFEVAVLTIREQGFQGYFGPKEYSHLERGGFRYWTMQNPLEFTVLVNRKPLAPEMPSREGEHGQPASSETLPEVYTSRYMASEVLSSGLVVPVHISMYPPEPLMGELTYELEHTVRELIPERRMYGDWREFSPTFWRHLDGIGPERVLARLRAIGTAHDGKPMALCCYEDLPKGQMCHRTIFAAWWREQSGQEVCELTNEGEVLKLVQLRHQIMPLRPR
jgi:hypothetical protein